MVPIVLLFALDLFRDEGNPVEWHVRLQRVAVVAFCRSHSFGTAVLA